MSCIFLVTPFVVANWSVLAGLAGGAAAQMGMTIIKSTSKNNVNADSKSMQKIEIEMENSEVLAEQMRRGESITLGKGDIRIVVTLDAQARMKAQVSGPESISKTELEALGQEFIGKVVQQYAYQKVMTELERKGFSLVEEKAEEDGRITLRVRKYE